MGKYISPHTHTHRHTYTHLPLQPCLGVVYLIAITELAATFTPLLSSTLPPSAPFPLCWQTRRRVSMWHLVVLRSSTALANARRRTTLCALSIFNTPHIHTYIYSKCANANICTYSNNLPVFTIYHADDVRQLCMCELTDIIAM